MNAGEIIREKGTSTEMVISKQMKQLRTSRE